MGEIMFFYKMGYSDGECGSYYFMMHNDRMDREKVKKDYLQAIAHAVRGLDKINYYTDIESVHSNEDVVKYLELMGYTRVIVEASASLSPEISIMAEGHWASKEPEIEALREEIKETRKEVIEDLWTEWVKE